MLFIKINNICSRVKSFDWNIWWEKVLKWRNLSFIQWVLCHRSEKKQAENEKEDLKEKVLLAFKGPRKASLEVEPCLAEVHIMISVRYCTLKVHLFCEDWNFLHGYNWIGSLTTRPQNFYIMNYKDAIISPNNELHSGVFNMLE